MESVGALAMLVVSLLVCLLGLGFVIHSLIKYWTDDSMGPK